jgi:hypothetical protein
MCSDCRVPFRVPALVDGHQGENCSDDRSDRHHCGQSDGPTMRAALERSLPVRSHNLGCDLLSSAIEARFEVGPFVVGENQMRAIVPLLELL